MFHVDIGPALVIFAALSKVVFGIPISVSAPVAAVIMCLAVYAICRERTSLLMGAAIVVVATSKLMFKFLFSQSGQGAIPDWLLGAAEVLTSDGVVIATSVLVFASATIFGITSPMRHQPKADDLPPEGEWR